MKISSSVFCHSFYRSSAISPIILDEVKEREFEWYFRDHLFRSMNKGLTRIKVEPVPKMIVDTYLRYRNDKLDEISVLLHTAIQNLVRKNVINYDSEFIELKGRITRKQCGKCFYVCYMSENEPLSCFRCFSEDLRDFPIRKSTTVGSK
jgi:hypothetical protein